MKETKKQNDSSYNNFNATKICQLITEFSSKRLGCILYCAFVAHTKQYIKENANISTFLFAAAVTIGKICPRSEVRISAPRFIVFISWPWGCSAVIGYNCFGEPCCLHIQGEAARCRKAEDRDMNVHRRGNFSSFSSRFSFYFKDTFNFHYCFWFLILFPQSLTFIIVEVCELLIVLSKTDIKENSKI
jgi:hypothetical protein